MKPFFRALGALALLCAYASAEIPDSTHPDYDLRVVAMPLQFKTMGLAFLPDGSLALATTDAVGGGEVPDPSPEHKVYLLRGASPDSLPSLLREISHGWKQISGIVAVGERIYVADRDGFYAIVDNNPAGDLDSNRKLIVKWPVSTRWNFGPFWHQWCFTPLYRDGYFYAPYSGSILTGGWSNVEATTPLSGAFLKWDLQGNLSAFAGGLRSPNGAALDPATGEMFVTDNQGSWLPSSTFMRMRPDRFYGHRQTPTDLDSNGLVVGTHAPNFAEAYPYEPPVAWLPHGTVRSSPSQPAKLPTGPFAGDWVIGDVNNPGLVRVYLDRVGDALNGAVFWFTKGMGYAAVNRIVPGPDGALWLGTLTTIGGNWPSGEKKPFYRLTAKEQGGAFDIRAVRSMDDGLEIDFTQPVNPDSIGPEHFTVQSWQYIRQREYGVGKQPTETRAVTAAEASKDRKRVHLKIPGLTIDRVIHIQAERLASSGGMALWNDEAWFTLNALSDRVWDKNAPTVAIGTAHTPVAKARVAWIARGGALEVSLACGTGACTGARFTAALYAPDGSRLAQAAGEDALRMPLPHGSGVGLLRVESPVLGNSQVTYKIAF